MLLSADSFGAVFAQTGAAWADIGASGRAAATRERLLTAAGIAFSKRGFHATSTRDIAAAAGMSPAAVYVHHES